MSTIINHTLQNLNVWKKGTEQPGPAKGQSKARKSQSSDSPLTHQPADVVEINNPVRRSIESNQVSHETSIEDVNEAQKLLQEVVGLMGSEDGKSQFEQVFNLNPDSLIKLF